MPDGTPFTPTEEDAAELRKRLLGQQAQADDFTDQRNAVLETDNPDDVAYDIRKGRELGIPREAIAGARDEYRNDDTLAKMQRLRDESPRTSAWLKEPENFAISRDEIDTLAATEKQFDPWLSEGGGRLMDMSKTWNSFFSNVGSAARAAIPGWKAQGAGLVQQQAESLGTYQAELDAFEKSRDGTITIGVGDVSLKFNPAWFGVGDPRPEAPLMAKMLNLEDPAGLVLREPGPDKFREEARRRFDAALKPVAAESARVGAEALAEQKALMPQTGDFVADSLLSGVTSLVNMAPSMAGFMLGGPTVGAGLMGGQVYGQTYSDSRNEYGLEPTAANERAVGHALVETVSERISLGFLDEIMKSGAPLWKKLATGMAAEQVQEQGATVGGDLVDWATIAQEKTLSELLAERPARAAQTALATLVASGGMQGTFLTIDYATRAYMRDAVAAQPTPGDKLIDGLLNDASRTKLRTRSPEKAAELADRITQGTGAETVVIDLDGLAQSLEAAGLNVMDAMTEMGIPADAINETAIVMGQVEVPTARLMVSEGIQTHRDKVQPHLRLKGEDLTPAQKETMSGEMNAYAKGTSEYIKELVASDADVASQKADVEDSVANALRESGFSGQPTVIRANSVLMSNFAVYGAMQRAKETGEPVDVAAFWKENGPSIVGSFGSDLQTDVLRQEDEAMLEQSIRTAVRMPITEVNDWVKQNTDTNIQTFQNGDESAVITFPLTDDPGAPPVMVGIRLSKKGRADVNLFLDNKMSDALDGVEDVAERSRAATEMFSRAVMVMRQYAAETPDLKAFTFTAAESQAEGTNPKSREALYRFLLSSMQFDGYTAYEIASQTSVVNTSDTGEKSANPLFPSAGFVLIRDGVDVNEFARNEILRGNQSGGGAGEVVTALSAVRLSDASGRRVDRGGSRVRAAGAGGAGGFVGDELNQLIGPRAKGADKAILGVAQKMAKERVKTSKGVFAKTKPKYTRQQIWDETAKLGQPWYQDKNGDWISEIEDGAIVVREIKGKMSEVVEMPSIYAQYPELAKQTADARDKVKVREEGGKDAPGTLGAYTKYPFLMGVNLRISDRSKQGQPYTATHEIQHAVDEIEGREMGRKNLYFQRDTEIRAFNTMYRRLWTMEERIATPPWKTEDEAVRWWGGLRDNNAPRAEYMKPGTPDPGPQAVPPERTTPKAVPDENVPEGARERDLAMPGERLQTGQTPRYNPVYGGQQVLQSGAREASVNPVALMGRTFLTVREMVRAAGKNERIADVIFDGNPAEDGGYLFKDAGSPGTMQHYGMMLKVEIGGKPIPKYMIGETAAQADARVLSEIRKQGATEEEAEVLRIAIARTDFDDQNAVLKSLDQMISNRPDLINWQDTTRLREFAQKMKTSTGEPETRQRFAPARTKTEENAQVKRVESALADKLLDMDKTVDQQPPRIAAALNDLIAKEQDRGDLIAAGYVQTEPGHFDGMTVNQLIRELAQSGLDEDGVRDPMMTLIQTLRAAGIVGAKYVPGGINTAEDAPPQTQSIVIFDERAPVLLTDQSGNLMQEKRGGYSPSTRQIVFTEARDVSTFMHETAHWFLDTLERLAPTEAWAAADLAEIDTWWSSVRDTPAMAAVRARYSVVASGGGWQVLYRGQPMERPFASEAESVARIEWRERQEAFAETFEQYLQTGKAPTPKLVEVFRAFRDWLVQLYKGMAPREREALNPAIQAVFDRVLAVDTEVDAASAEAFRDADTMAKDMLAKGVITERQYRMVGERLNKAREEVKEEMIARALKEEMRQREDWWAKERARVKGDLARAFDKSEVGRVFNWLAYGEWKGDVGVEQPEPGSEFADEAYGALFQSMRETIRPAAQQDITEAPQAPSRQAMLSDLNTLTRMAEMMLADAQSEALANATLRLRQTMEREDGTPNDEFRGQYVSGLMMLSDALQGVQGGDVLAAAVTQNLETETGAGARSALEYRGIRIMAPEQIGEPPMLLVNEGMYSADALFQSGPRTFNPPGHGPVAPPPDVPPVRLDLKIVRDLYGEEAVKKLPAAVRRRSSTSSNVTDMLAMIETVRKTLAKKRKGPQTLTQFIMAKKRTKQDGTKEDIPWGIKGAADELKAMGLGKLINEKSGRTLDYVREAAEEAGFIRPRAVDADLNREASDLDTTLNDLLEALAREAKGEAVVRIGEEGDTKEAEDARIWATWLEQNGVDIYEADKKKLRASVEAMLSATDESLISPDQAAELFGFPNGEELLAALAQVGNRDAFLNAQADRKMAEEFGDMMKDGTLIEEAREAARLDILGRQSEIELEALSRAVGQQASANYAKQMARDIIALRTVKEIAAYERDLDNERRFSKQALAAVAKGDYAAALKAKQRQIIAAQMYREGKKAHERIEKQRRDLLKYLTSESRRDKIANDYLERIDAVLDDFELRVSKQGPSVQKARQSAAAYVAWMTEQGREAEIAPEAMLLATQASLKTWRNLTADEVDYLVGTIENLAHLGRTKQRLLNDKEKRQREAVLDELEATLLAAPSAKTTREKSFTPTVGEGVATWLRKAHARLTRMEFQFVRLDGREGGPLHTALFQPFADAADRETLRMRDAAVKMQALYAAFTPAERNALFHRRISTPELKVPGKGLTLMDAVVIGLNWGNAGNRQALVDGYGWDAAAIEAMLNRVLNDKHWNFIEGVWDLIGSYRDDAFALEKSITGVAPKAVEGVTFTLASGRKVEGKYYPLKYDSGQARADSVKQARLDEKQMLNEMGKSFSKPMTKTGHLIERVGSGGKPVKLSIGVFHEHVASVIHDIAYRRAIIDVYKLVTSPRFADAYIQAAGREQYDTLVPWIAQIANERKDEPGGYVTDLLRGARRNFSIMAMGLKVGTAVQQATGVLQGIPLIGSRYAAQGLFKALGGGPASFWSAWNWVSLKSEFMRDRPMGFDRDVREVTNKLQERTPLGAVRRNAFILIGVMDTAVSTGVWIGAYDKAMDGNVPGMAKGDEEAAIAYADSIVRRSQVAGRMQDLPQMMRGTELEKLMTVVYSYFSGLYNETASEILRVRGGQLNPLAFSANMTILFVVVPLIASTLAGRLFADDDDDELDEKVVKELASNAVSTVPFVRDIINATINPQFGYQLSPAGSIIEGGTKAASNLATGEGFGTEYATKQSFNLLGLLFGLPTGQLWITGEYAYGVATGEEDPAADPADAAREALLRDSR